MDTRGVGAQKGGIYGVLVTNMSGGPLGRYRYLLFDVRATQAHHPFANTFYSEIDVQSAEPDFRAEFPAGVRGPDPFSVRTPDGQFTFAFDVRHAPELESWVRKRLSPAVVEWYPKLAEILHVENLAPPGHVQIILRPGRGVAATSGSRITANSRWIDRERNREAVGAIVHELVHVLQQYDHRPPGTPPPPGWLVEGIADYLRWFVVEPESHGADLIWLRRQQGVQLRHDAGYRISANFLDWVIRRHDPELIRHLNAALRMGRYEETLWEKWTGRTLEDLARAWRAETEQALRAQ
ncbi:MAG: basic secretory family protein [Kiritimatiellae bacterium]|nr:basic secretory family protein [Kiritimatiellia bacterium]